MPDKTEFLPIGPKGRLMTFLHHLKYKRRKTIKEYTDLLEVAPKTVYRYIEELEKHFILDKDEYNRYFIHTEVNDDEISVSLTAEEMQFLNGLVTKSNHKLKGGLVNKLDLNIGLSFTDDGDFATIIDQLETAINSKRQVVLKEYLSGSTQTPRNKYVEPIAITELKYLTAFDIRAKKTKIYAISRIKNVKITDEWHEYDHLHQHIKPDVFGVVAGHAFTLKLNMSTRAHLLMREEFPRSVEFVRQQENGKYKFHFNGHIYGLEGAGRFVMGLLDEVEIIEPDELREYIFKKISGYDLK